MYYLPRIKILDLWDILYSREYDYPHITIDCLLKYTYILLFNSLFISFDYVYRHFGVQSAYAKLTLQRANPWICSYFTYVLPRIYLC